MEKNEIMLLTNKLVKALRDCSDSHLVDEVIDHVTYCDTFGLEEFV